jgi:ADP-ribose pyrophosphatase YjhB (NUDIX family)
LAEPRIRVSAILRWRGRILLARHEKAGGAVWLLPGGGVKAGESLLRALERELWEETGLFPDGLDVPLEGPVAIVDSISPEGTSAGKHVVHVIFAADLSGTLEDVVSRDDAVRGHRAFLVRELDSVLLHPPITRFLQRWQPGDPAVYLGEMWAP